jgi:hypothetical protein
MALAALSAARRVLRLSDPIQFAVSFVIEDSWLRATFHQCWVRQLSGKPVDFTPPDSEFDTPRIQLKSENYESGNKTFLTHWDLESLADRAASLILVASLGVKRKAIKTPFAFCVPIFGLPARFFIINVIQLSCQKTKSV